LCPSSVYVVATFPGTVLFPLLYSLLLFFTLIHWFFLLSSFVIPRRCLKNFICAVSKPCSSLSFSNQKICITYVVRKQLYIFSHRIVHCVYNYMFRPSSGPHIHLYGVNGNKRTFTLPYLGREKYETTHIYLIISYEKCA